MCQRVGFRVLPWGPADRDEPSAAVARPAPVAGWLLGLEEEALFYSFGLWKQRADVEAMRGSPQAAEGIARLHALCVDGPDGIYRVVAESQ